MSVVINTLKDRLKILEENVNHSTLRLKYYNNSITEVKEFIKATERGIQELTEAINKLQSEND